jgi:hypothetical protein
MKIVPGAIQGTAEWFAARCGIPTASEFHEFMTTDFELRKGDMLKSYIARKVAEKWNKGPLPGFTTTISMEFGNILEEEAIPWFSLEYNADVKQGLFVTTDDGSVGCSPDGLVGRDAGLEAKCPSAEKHTRYLLDGTVPKDYLAQVHGCLYVTGRDRWVFMSYHRKFPKLVVTIERDETIMEKIALTLSDFNKKFDEAMNHLRQIEAA